jgi:hypothetical protein
MIHLLDKKEGGKGLAALIIARKKDKSGEEKEQVMKKPTSEEGNELDVSMGLEAAMGDLIEALKMKDKKMAVEALKSFVQMCMDGMPEEEEEEDSEEEDSEY